MNLHRCLFIGTLILLIATNGCGGGSNPNNVTVSISPSATTVAANGQVTLQATVHGAANAFINDRFITEDEASTAACTWKDTPPPPGSCLGGTIQETTVGALTVTYYAPDTPGTFHVTAQWFLSANPPVTKNGRSVVTVTP
jgi:hypothetical protein